MQQQYSQTEMNDRVMWAQKILIAARDIRNLPALEGARLQQSTEAWEAAFSRIATAQLPVVYRIGLSKNCTTAEQFKDAWEMQMEEEAAARNRKATIAGRDNVKQGSPIPQHILESWTQGSATATATATR